MKLMVIDGNSIINRAYYGIRPLTTRDGLYTHAVFGFLTTLLRLEGEEAQLAALRHIGERGLNVAASEEYIDALLQKPQRTDPPRRPVYVIKDVRLFLNSVNRGMETIRRAGVNARYDKQESEEEITITIQIPKRKAAAG